MTVVRAAGLSFRFHARALAVAALCLAVALGTGVLLIGSGDFPMSPADVVRALLGQGSPADSLIVNQIRLPRVAAGLAVGAALGLAGAIFQSLVRNPLGSPDVLGFSQGAATGVLAVIVLTGGGSVAVAAGAAGGGLGTGLVVYAVAGRHGAHGQRLILVGIGVAAILTGVNGYLLTQAQITDAARAVLWLTGSLDGRDWADAAPALAGLAVLGPLVLAGCGRALRMLEMGDDAAHGLGVPIERVRLVMLAAAVLLTSLAAAAAGPVAFVALTAPQLARALGLLPQSSIAPEGITVADLVSRGRYPHQSLLRQWSREDERVVAESMAATGVADLAGRTVDELSGGQRQRVWIAMVLAQRTPLLLLDEPTTYLDIAHQIEVLDLCARLHAEGRTVVAVLHDLNHAARYATHMIAMRDGRIVAQGDPSSVVTSELVQEVFRLPCRVIDCPETGTPLVVPAARGRVPALH